MISPNGTLVRTPVGDVSIQGRNTQGVRLIRLDHGERLIGVERGRGVWASWMARAAKIWAIRRPPKKPPDSSTPPV